MQLQPGINERPNQPRPDSPLMIGGVARSQVAVIGRLVVRLSRRQRTQAQRRKQTLAYHVHHWMPAILIEDRMRERDGKNLIGTARWIVALLAVHHVIEVSALGVPEAPIEGGSRPLGMFGDGLGPRGFL